MYGIMDCRLDCKNVVNYVKTLNEDKTYKKYESLYSNIPRNTQKLF